MKTENRVLKKLTARFSRAAAGQISVDPEYRDYVTSAGKYQIEFGIRFDEESGEHYYFLSVGENGHLVESFAEKCYQPSLNDLHNQISRKMRDAEDKRWQASQREKLRELEKELESIK